MKKTVLIPLMVLLAFGCKPKTPENVEEKANTNTSTPNNTALTTDSTGAKKFEAWKVEDSTKIIKTPSGLRYYIVREGNGNLPQKGQKVMVNYHGMLTNGSVFDSSFERGQPFEFALGQGQVIAGWDEGVAKCKIGTQVILMIPYQLGYGEMGSPPRIPGKAELIFDVELLGIM